MPLMRISLRTGKSAAYKGAIVEATYQAMRAAWSIPEHDRFAVVSEHDATTLEYDSGYLDIARTDDIVIIQITANDTRTTAQKQAFYNDLADRLHADPGIRKEDVFINLVEVKAENWSFGNGVAQYVKP
jgi:4-oxalocrotonate tautomerase